MIDDFFAKAFIQADISNLGQSEKHAYELSLKAH